MLEYDVSSMNSLIEKTGRMIDNDPLLKASDEINSIKENFEAIHKVMSGEATESEKKGFLASLIGKFIARDEAFQFKSFEGKIQSIFFQFDTTYESVCCSHNMYQMYWDGLEKEITSLTQYINENRPTTDEEAKMMANYNIMLSNLQLSLERIRMSEVSAKELKETMRVGRPIFQAVLSSCMIEVAGQRTLEASAQMIWTMSATIDGLSNKLTESTVKNSFIALQASSTPLLNSNNLEKNMLMLGKALEDISSKKDALSLKMKND